jgi:hypothetical protein
MDRAKDMANLQEEEGANHMTTKDLYEHRTKKVVSAEDYPRDANARTAVTTDRSNRFMVPSAAFPPTQQSEKT